MEHHRASCSRRSTARRRRCCDSNHKAHRARLRLRATSTSSARCRSGSRRWTRPTNTILIDGNTATALGCVYAGATVAAWYPITPATSRDGRVQGLLRGVPQGSRDRQEQLLHPAGRGRAGGDRHGHRRQLERRARLHVDGGPRHLAHERAHRPRLLRRDPGGDRRRAAHRPVDGHADAHAAGRHPRLRVRLARRHQAHPALPRRIPSECFTSRSRPSTSPSASRRRCSCSPISTSA